MGDNLPYINLGPSIYIASVGVGKDHTCVIVTELSVKCWGRNDVGQLGYEDTSIRGDASGFSEFSLSFSNSLK